MNLPIIILAAGMGTRLGEYTKNKPKGMVLLRGKPLLEWQLSVIDSVGGFKKILVGGYKHEELKVLWDHLELNQDYASTNMVYSLLCAEKYFENGFIVAYGDIVYEESVIKSLAESDADISVVVDKDWRSYWASRTEDILSDAESLKINSNGTIASIGQKESSVDNIEGQYIGLVKFSEKGVQILKQEIQVEKRANNDGKSYLCAGKTLENLYMTDLLQGLIQKGYNIFPVYINGKWLEIDNPKDLAVAEMAFRGDGEVKIIRENRSSYEN